MSVFSNPKTQVRLWAALCSDFEGLMARFMGSKSWRYIHFARICREMQITLVMHVTQARGKTKDEHYKVVTAMILQICKELWLKAADVVRGRNKTIADQKMELKRSLGGFYLLYTLYEKQPIKDRVKITLGVDDLKGCISFCNAVPLLNCQREVIFMIEYLMFKNAFHYSVYPEDFRCDAGSRSFLNNSRSEAVDLTRRMRYSQDILAFSSVNSECESALQSMGVAKNTVARNLLKTVQPRVLYNHLNKNSTFDMFVQTLPTKFTTEALRILNKIVDKPILTLENLTATEAIRRRMTMETQQRMQRARKKAVQQAMNRDGGHKATRPYVREGGIFGRKKEVEEGEDKGKTRERGACNGNLWVFINGYDFDKPIGVERQKARKPASKDTGDNVYFY